MRSRSNLQRQVEDRWGLPFWFLVGEFAIQGLNISQTAKALGLKRDTFHKMVMHSGRRSLWPKKTSIAVQYVIDSGESFRAACVRLAATTYIYDAARQLGFSNSGSLRDAMRARGFEVKFRTYREVVSKAIS